LHCICIFAWHSHCCIAFAFLHPIAFFAFSHRIRTKIAWLWVLIIVIFLRIFEFSCALTSVETSNCHQIAVPDYRYSLMHTCVQKKKRVQLSDANAKTRISDANANERISNRSMRMQTSELAID
jgi:hypothetical protein